MRVTVRINGLLTTISGKTPTELVLRALERSNESNSSVVSNENTDNRLPYTFHAYSDYFLAQYKENKKSGTYYKELCGYLNNYLVPAFENTPLRNIYTGDIQQMLDSITSARFPDRELSEKTKREILALLSMILESAKEDRLIKVNPAKSMRLTVGGLPSREVPAWEEVDWAILYKKVIPALKYQQDRLFLMIDMYHGLRKCEIAALKWTDIDLENGIMHVHSSVQWASAHGGSNKGHLKNPKTENGHRSIVLSRFVLPYLYEADKSKPYLIYGTRYPAKKGDQPPSFSVLESIIGRIRSACLAQGIKHKYLTHELRHTVVTFDIDANIDDETLAHNHGHFKAEFTKKQYGRSILTQRKRAREKSDKFMGEILETLSVSD